MASPSIATMLTSPDRVGTLVGHRAVEALGAEGAARHRYLPSLSVAGAGLLVSVVAFVYVDWLENARIAAEFESVATQPIFAIQRQVEADLGSVISLAAFYNGSQYVERGEFAAFAAPILDWHPSVQALAWVPRVAAFERDGYETRAREDGHLGFQITALGEGGDLVEAPARSEYFPAYYVEPRTGNERALGFDLGSDPVRRAALEAAESGEMRATAPLRLVQEPDDQLGFLAMAPVYRGGSSRAPSARRQETPRGFVLAAFRIGDLVAHALSRDQSPGGPAAPEFELQIHDVGPGGDRLVFANRPPDTRREWEELFAGLHAARLIDVAGRTWQVVVAPPSGAPDPRQVWLPWAVLAAGLGFTAFAAPAYHCRRRGNERLHRLARSLDEKNRTLEALSAKLSAYLPRQVYQSIFTGARDASITTERKKLTVFFSDIEGFTGATADLEPEDLTYLLNDYFSEMSEIAVRFGATIDKFVGDATLMFFGDPESRGVREDALACVRMAVVMQRRMVDLRAKWQRMGYRRSFHMRIGINTGYCDVGNFGSRERMAYTIVGGEVNKAARMQGLAGSDGIAMTGETYALVRDHVEAREGEPVHLKGLPGQIQPYFVVGAGDRGGDHQEGDGRAVIRSESEALRVFIDLTRLDPAARQAAARQMDEIALRLRG